MKLTKLLPLGLAMFLVFALLGCNELIPGDMMSASTRHTPLSGDHNDHHGNGDSVRNAGVSDSCTARHQDSCSMDMDEMHEMMHSGGGMHGSGMHGSGMHGSGMHGDTCMSGMTMHGMDSCTKK